MSKARELADLGSVTTRLDEVGNTDGALSNRNVIINGNFSIWQRGTSFTPNPVIFGADRFAAYKASASAGDYARSNDVPTGQGFTYSGYFNAADIRHSIELPTAGERGVFADGSKWTLSFWVKAGASGTATANLGWANGVSASTLTNWGADQSYSYSTSWERKTITFTVGGSITSSHAAVLLYMQAVSGLYLTGVQLEQGDTATPFEHRSYGDELARCQRYFWQAKNSTDYQPLTQFGHALSSTRCDFNITLPVTMRSAPSITSTPTNFRLSTPGGTTVLVTGVDYATGYNNEESTHIRLGYNVAGGLTVTDPYFLRSKGTSGSYIRCDAEL